MTATQTQHWHAKSSKQRLRQTSGFSSATAGQISLLVRVAVKEEKARCQTPTPPPIPTAVAIRQALAGAGYDVWLDLERMSGLTIEAMAEAVERAATVVVLASRRYRESENCRSEASYAYSRRKPIVPVLAQEHYKPEGWLGFIMGTKLYVDFSGARPRALHGAGVTADGAALARAPPVFSDSHEAHAFDGCVRGLLRELGHRGKGSPRSGDASSGGLQTPPPPHALHAPRDMGASLVSLPPVDSIALSSACARSAPLDDAADAAASVHAAAFTAIAQGGVSAPRRAADGVVGAASTLSEDAMARPEAGRRQLLTPLSPVEAVNSPQHAPAASFVPPSQHVSGAAFEQAQPLPPRRSVDEWVLAACGSREAAELLGAAGVDAAALRELARLRAEDEGLVLRLLRDDVGIGPLGPRLRIAAALRRLQFGDG